MPQTAQHSVNDLALAVEPVAAATWPARRTQALDGWILRFSEGFSSRANSVSTLVYSGRPLDASIGAVEAAYRAQGLPPLFQITPASRPVGLEDALRARGYIHKSPTMVMVADAAPIAASGAAQVFGAVDADFTALTREGSHSPADGDERLATLARTTLPKAFVVARENEDAASCGASIAADGWAGVYVMRTTPARRRHGHGRRVLGAIAAWALTQGAERLFLQVDEANTAGRALYAQAGFREAYRCLHYGKKD